MLSRESLDAAFSGFTCYLLTTAVVLAGVWLGVDLFRPPPRHAPLAPRSFGQALGNWDGIWYARIVRDGYDYDPGRQSKVAFFPAFPLLGGTLTATLGLEPETALLIIAHVFLAGLFVALAIYVRERYPDEAGRLTDMTLVVFGLWPATFFFRMAYTESLFVFLLVVALFGMQRQWPVLLIALSVGAATAARPVGLALVPVFAIYLWQQADRWAVFLFRAFLVLPLACWGIAAYMIYQQEIFGDGLAFMKTQQHWARRPLVPLAERLQASVLLEPIWSVYDETSPAYWERHEPVPNPLFSAHFANPLYFLASVGFVVLGALKHWLNSREWLLCTLLLAIPYFSHSWQTFMMSEARFSAAAFPVYLVLGQMAIRTPLPVLGPLIGLSGFFLGSYSAMFAAYYPFH